MKITDVKTILANRYLFVEIHTDEGLVGIGESGTWGFLDASMGAVEALKTYLIGQDPLRIEHHWQYMYHCWHFRGAAIMGAISAIDIALWVLRANSTTLPSTTCWAVAAATRRGSMPMPVAKPRKRPSPT
ncbi:hypothetical protein [Candidatus Symbiopectobacterium sp. 'North America']|uniref:hypothetical protein n=1 Tax=Candidatus Symbiopectobacterium sp. 'North America' TaxID=2794574 RepID=UPI001FD3290A|nr:hypothetical protein [Candidatus Symbiopectobacterium sp. 'North America']